MLNLLPSRVQSAARGIQKLTSVSRPTVTPDAVPFLEPIDEIVEEPPPQGLRRLHYIIAGMFVTLLIVTAIVKVDVVVTGTGRLSTETPPIVMQAIDRAIIREMTVKAGDVVKKGQVLATLDPTFAQADLTSLTVQRQALKAQMDRLEAEAEDRPFEIADNPSTDEQLQKTLYEQRQAQYSSRLRIFDEELLRRRANLRTTEDHRSSQAKQLEIAKDVEGMRSQMLEKQVGSKLNYLEAQASRMRIEQDLTDSVNHGTEQNHDLQSKEAERQSFIDEWRHQILDSLVSVRTELSKVSENANKAELIKDLVVLTAPDDGVVLEVIRRGIGSIVREAEPIVTLVESKAKLEADITIASGDVGYVQAGDEVLVKVDAFPYTRHGYLKGKLFNVSEESFASNGTGSEGDVPNTGASGAGTGAFHRGRVIIANPTLESMPEGARLIPGMTLRAEIKVGSRSVLSYFLSPITRVMNESIREP